IISSGINPGLFPDFLLLIINRKIFTLVTYSGTSIKVLFLSGICLSKDYLFLSFLGLLFSDNI
ncbi:hypothetical protein LJE86_10520, partial [bacterium BMS3Abin03]|nr:hypothetical protein [bacterium BMS3Abin03]